jgi:nitrite reductase/ring-hydroxylating ferredoxin subunit
MDRDDVPGIPNGWYAVAWSSEIGPGEVRRLYYFEEELALFRTRGGEVRVLSAFCPHLGAHLAEGGRVLGDAIRCPFHAWQFDGESGQCVEIPYCERIPPRARVRAWEACESNGMIFVWHHAEEKPSDWEVPAAPQFSDPDWSEMRTFEIEVPIHMQDMAENNLDPVHFQIVHGMLGVPDTEIEFAENGRFMHAVSFSEQQTPQGSFETSLLRDTWCLGMSSVESRGIPGAGLYMFSSTSPIDRHNTISRWSLTATRNLVDTVGEEWFAGITKGVEDDLRIWNNKIHRQNPVFCEADKLLVEFRSWARQFYSPAA